MLILHFISCGLLFIFSRIISLKYRCDCLERMNLTPREQGTGEGILFNVNARGVVSMLSIS